MGDTLSALRALRRLILQLSVISHASAMQWEASPPDAGEDIGGKRPSGGIDHLGDRQMEYRQKSADYFARKLFEAATPEEIVALEAEARQALEYWRKTVRESIEPEKGDFDWKAYVGNSPESIGDLARKFAITRQQVIDCQRQYGTEESRRVRKARTSAGVSRQPRPAALRGLADA